MSSPSSSHSDLWWNTHQYNNNHRHHAALQKAPGFRPPYPENARRVKEEGEDKQKRNDYYYLKSEGKLPADSIIKREASIVHYCRNCGHTTNGTEEADKPCANCNGELVLSTL